MSDRHNAHRQLGRIYARPDQCHARWWDGDIIHSCDAKARKYKLRCSVHQPDGSRLDSVGEPFVKVTR